MKRRRTFLPGAVTLEASLVIPVFLYFFINILTLFDVVRVQSTLHAALHQTGSRICLHAFDVQWAGAAANVLTVPYAAGEVRSYFSAHYPEVHCVEGGVDGIHYLHSDFFPEEGIIDIVADYKVQPLLRVIGFRAFPMEARFYGHTWTGYRIPGEGEPEEEEAEEIVYIARTGTVYHRNVGCTYLTRGIRRVEHAELSVVRNASGAVYYACERCGGGSGSVYVTHYGTRYHASDSCTELARDISAVTLTEAEGMGRCPCSACGN